MVSHANILGKRCVHDFYLKRKKKKKMLDGL